MAFPIVLTVNLGLLVVILGGGIAVDRDVDLGAVRAGLPSRLRVGIELLAFAVFGSLLFVEPVEIPIVDETIAALGVFVLLWIGLPVFAARFVDAGTPPRPTYHGCDR